MKIIVSLLEITVMKLAMAMKIVFDCNKHATIVVYMIGTLIFTAKAAEEVIASAVTFYSL